MFFYSDRAGRGPKLFQRSRAFAALVVGLFGGSSLQGAQACSCVDQPLCDSFNDADVVLRAKATSKTSAESSSSYVAQFARVTYTVDVVTLYKKEANATYREGGELTFTTTSSGSLCGISLEIGDEHLLGLNRHSSSNELWSGLCGVFSDWSEVDTAALKGCVSTDSTQALTPTQAIQADTTPEASSALRLIASKGFIAAGVAWVAGVALLGFDPPAATDGGRGR